MRDTEDRSADDDKTFYIRDRSTEARSGSSSLTYRLAQGLIKSSVGENEHP